MFTADQRKTRNPGIGKSIDFVTIELIALKVLKQFNFLRKGVVSEVDVKSSRVRVVFPHSGNRPSKWLKVYFPFASHNEGIVAFPNEGDVGLVFFLLGDLNAGVFIASGSFSDVHEQPSEVTKKSIVIKRNGTIFKIFENGLAHVLHSIGNLVRIGSGFVAMSTPDQTVRIESEDGEMYVDKTIFGNKAVCQRYYVKDRPAGSSEPMEALAYSKIEAQKQFSSVEYRRTVTAPEGDMSSCRKTCVAQSNPDYTPPVSNKQELVTEERLNRYIDIGNTSNGELNIANWSRTREVKKIREGQDLAIAEGALVERNGEISFNVWLGRKAFAFFRLRVAEKNDQRTASCMIQVMADGRLSDIVVNESGIFLNGVTKEVAKQDDGSAMLAFEDSIRSIAHELDEVD
jgi:phage baseplate assembly protein gpV